MNFIFAAVFALALVVGGVNVFTAGGVDAGNGGAGAVDKEKEPAVERSRNDENEVNTVRRGRRIQVDGFLLEWRGTDANVWPGSNWRWDAVSTVDGVAGYISLPADSIDNDAVDDTVNNNDKAAARSDWIITLQSANTGRSLEIKLPGNPAGKFFAFDKGAFEAGGPLTAEWVVPWDFFDDGGDSSTYKLSINAIGGGGALRPLVLSVEVPGQPQAPSGLMTRLLMVAVIAVLTIALVVIRRRQIRESSKS